MQSIKNDADKKAVQLIVAQQVFGRSYAVAPGTPADRVKILRDAFMSTMTDKDFLAEAEKVKVTITPSSGEKVQQVVQRLHASTADVIKRAKEIIEP
jgi:tripartite-type tricarboxylate transporter receptor subunit TctC